MATTRLYRTPAGAGNQVKWTWSGWIKIAPKPDNSTYWGQTIFCAYSDSNNYTELALDNSGSIDFLNVTGGSTDGRLTTNRKFRDPGAWYNIIVVWDSANASAGDRMKFYVNGVEETDFSDDTNPSSSLSSIMNSTVVTEIGSRAGGANYFNGCMAHTHFADGQAYAPSVFGETDSTSGIWVAKTAPTVTYGTNGFFLKYQDKTNYGDDSSGETNDFTTAGTPTQTKDNPDNNFANFNTLNLTTTWVPLFYNGATAVLSQDGSGNYWGASSTLGISSGKWYAEFKPISASHKPSFGITQAPNENAYWESYLGKQLYDYSYVSDGTTYNNDSTGSGSWNTFTTGDIIGVAVDLDNLKIYFSKNGTWENSGDPTSGASGTGAAFTITSTAASTPGTEASGSYFFACSDQGSGQDTMAVNFGNGYFQTTAVSSPGTHKDDAGIGDFEYDVPAGYYALCTNNLGDQS